MKTFSNAVVLTVLCLFSTPSSAQISLSDDFSDGDLIQNPTWYGDTSQFGIVDQQLATKSDSINHSFSLTTPITPTPNREWSWDVSLPFSTSSLNYVDILLYSDSLINGGAGARSFLRIGGSKDRLELFQDNGLGDEVSLMTSHNSITHKFYGRVKVVVTDDSIWTISYDSSFLGNYTHIGPAIHQAPGEHKYTGIRVRQSTSGFHKKHRFDNFYTGPIRVDTVPPVVQNLEVVNDSTLKISFSEILNSATIHTNFFVLLPSMHPKRIALNEAVLHLIFDRSLGEGNHELRLGGMEDVSGNRLKDTTVKFSFTLPPQPELHDVLITEIMADPNPRLKLPEVEYLEFYNRSTTDYNVKDWLLSDASRTVELPDVILKAGSYVIVCDSIHFKQFTSFGEVMAIGNLPALNNGADSLLLKNNRNVLVHELKYSNTWHTEGWKQDGGWSLEMIDVDQPCLGAANWASSIDSRGGSPGETNSVARALVDNQAPRLTSAEITGWNRLELHFDESIATYQPQTSDFSMEDIQPTSAELIGHRGLVLTFSDDFEKHKIYELNYSNISDCIGNRISTTSVSVAIPEEPEEGDIVINEMLFHAPDDGSEFVELFNVSEDVFDLRNLILTKTEAGSWVDFDPITDVPWLFFPKEYVAITRDTLGLTRYRNSSERQNLMESSSVPSLPNDHGEIYLVRRDGQEIDALRYSSDMHFDLIDNKKGVSLERRRVEVPTSHASNWTSASYAENYGTPGYVNSQALTSKRDHRTGSFSIEPDPFSPNGDGYNDVLQINYVPEDTNTNVTVAVYDRLGRFVARPVNSVLAGESNLFLWNGIREDGTTAAPDIYIIKVDAISLGGGYESFKKGFTLEK